MSKVLKRLYLGDVVKSFGTKQLRKLTTEKQLPTPVISLSGTELTIADDTDKAETFLLLVDDEATINIPAKSNTAEGSSVTELSCSIDCAIGDTVVVAIATRDTLTLSSGWNLISTSGINSADTTNGQRLSWAYKIAESTSETITVTQASSQRLYINMIALTGVAELVDNGYTYRDDTTSGELTVSKPSGLVLWSMATTAWLSYTPYKVWSASNNIYIIQLGSSTASRLGLGYDETEETSVTLTSGTDSSTMIVGCLSVRR